MNERMNHNQIEMITQAVSNYMSICVKACLGTANIATNELLSDFAAVRYNGTFFILEIVAADPNMVMRGGVSEEDVRILERMIAGFGFGRLSPLDGIGQCFGAFSPADRFLRTAERFLDSRGKADVLLRKWLQSCSPASSVSNVRSGVNNRKFTVVSDKPVVVNKADSTVAKTRTGRAGIGAVKNAKRISSSASV